MTRIQIDGAQVIVRLAPYAVFTVPQDQDATKYLRVLASECHAAADQLSGVSYATDAPDAADSQIVGE